MRTHWRTHRWYLVFVLAAGLVQLAVLTAPFGDWWFEDDTPHRVFVRDNANPVAYFTDDEQIRALSLGHAVTPWFPFTFWIDHQIDPLSPAPAYWHTALSLLVTGLLLYLVLALWCGPFPAAFGAASWFFLPSTVTITEFLSTRHYLEGLALSLAALLCASLAVKRPALRGVAWWAAIFYLLSTTTKEVYVAGTFAALLVLYLWFRRWRLALGIVGCGVLYTLYRLWALGLVGKNVGAAVLSDYYLFPLRLPYIFAGHWGGILIVVLTVPLLIFCWQRASKPLFGLLAFAAVAVALLIAIYPVTANIVHQYQALGTWYRVVFLWNTGLLAGFVLLLSRAHKAAEPFWRQYAITTTVLMFGCLVLGGARAADKWDALKADYRADSAFYLAHPDRLLYSDLPAPWFLYGVHKMYRPNQPPHFITRRIDHVTPKEAVPERLDRFENLWLRQNGVFVNRADLRETLRANAEAAKSPLLTVPPDR